MSVIGNNQNPYIKTSEMSHLRKDKGDNQLQHLDIIPCLITNTCLLCLENTVNRTNWNAF